MLSTPNQCVNGVASTTSVSAPAAAAAAESTIRNCNVSSEQHVVWNASVPDPLGLKDVIARIKGDVAETGYCEVPLESATDRRRIHMWCEDQKLLHMSFSSGNQKFETVYYCTHCREWVQERETRYSRCCDDGSCGDYTIYCRKCGYPGDENVVWNQDAHEEPDECKRKTVNVNTNNVIAISTDIARLYPIFRNLGVKENKAEQWIKNREIKLRNPAFTSCFVQHIDNKLNADSYSITVWAGG